MTSLSPPARTANLALVAITASLAGCGSSSSPTVTVTESSASSPQPKATTAAAGQAAPDRTQAATNRFEGLYRCAADWNKTASDAQLKALALAALIDPVRRDRKATAWVDGWNFQSGEVAMIGPGRRGEMTTVNRGQCLVATGPDVGKVYLKIGRRWEQISGDAPTEAAFPAVMMAKAGGDAWIRRDGTVTPIFGQR